MLDKISNFISPFNQSEEKSVNAASPMTQPDDKKPLHSKAKLLTQKTTDSFMGKIWSLVAKVKEVARIVLTIAISAFLYWVNPSLFAIGFIAGIIFDEHIKTAIQKIKNVWNNQKIETLLGGAFACALSLPVTLATASLLWSAHLGSLVTTAATQIKNENGAIA